MQTILERAILIATTGAVSSKAQILIDPKEALGPMSSQYPRIERTIRIIIGKAIAMNQGSNSMVGMTGKQTMQIASKSIKPISLITKLLGHQHPLQHNYHKMQATSMS